MSESLLPWVLATWETLTQDSERATHAWLFKGPKGVGKTETATEFARYLLSEGAADSTKVHDLFSVGSHPDFHVVMPEVLCGNGEGALEHYALRYAGTGTGKPKSVISVDQVRQMIERVSTHAHTAVNKCVVIAPADCMNSSSANALLKILEEPPARTLFLLVTAMPHRLPPTIVSRCSPVDFRVPDHRSARTWLLGQGVASADVDVLLALAGGAPLRARQLDQAGFLGLRRDWMNDVLKLMGGDKDPLGVATRWSRPDRSMAMDWLHRLVLDLMRVVLCERPHTLYNPDLRGRLQELRKRINVTALFELSERLGRGKQLLETPVDHDLIMEDLLIRVGKIGTNPRH